MSGASFELVALTSSRQDVDPQSFVEEAPEAVALTPPVVAQPVKTLHVEGCLSMQVLVETSELGLGR